MATSLDNKVQRPTGSLGKLFDESAALSNKPIQHLEEIAKLALSDGNIDERRYKVLQYRVPFSGFEYESLRVLGKKRLGISGEMISQIEDKIYQVLTDYIRWEREGRKQEVEDVHELGLHRLPWRKLYGEHGLRTYHALRDTLLEKSKPVTAGSVVELFERAAKEEGTLPQMINLGPRTFRMIYEIFLAVNIELPIELPKKEIISLSEYSSEEQEGGDILNLDLQRWPWKSLYDGLGTRAYNALKRAISDRGKPLIVRTLVELYEEIVQNPKVLLGIRDYGRKGVIMTYDISNRFGVELPQVKLPPK